MHDERELLHKTPQPSLPLPITYPRIALAGAYYAPKGKDFPLHRDAMWELHYYRLGYIECVIGEERFESQPGMFTMVPPWVEHCERAWTEYANYHVFIDAPPDSDWPRVMFDDADQSIMHVCAAIVREQKLPDSEERKLMLQTLGTQLYLLLARARDNTAYVGRHDSDALVRRAERVLNERYSTSITIEQVAAEIGVSTSYLRAQFKARRAMTPLAYLHQVRLRHALSWLQSTNRSLESVAASCGFDSASHLSRHIKHATGKAPGALRAHAQAQADSKA